jgi:hypothetical protein
MRQSAALQANIVVTSSETLSDISAWPLRRSRSDATIIVQNRAVEYPSPW